jgi:ABC-type transporter Mla maintaining outer membrane lipid asymmetry ATPase subunit MlaF
MKAVPSPEPGVPAISMRGVVTGQLRDQRTVAIEAADWTVAPGEFWALAGLQGSGKTDFLMMTAGLMPPQAGEYLLFGERMPIFEQDRLAARLRLGVVFDGGQLFNHLTVTENVAIALRYHHNLTCEEAEPVVKQWLEATELEPWSDSTPGALGRNWQKRAGLARALILKPEVLLVDNPLAGLDLRHTSWWLGFLEQLSRGHDLLDKRPMTIIVTGADLRHWRKIAQHFAILRDKQFKVLGNWSQIEAATEELANLGVLQ